MPVETNIGKITSAIEAGRRAAASIDYGPIKSLNTISLEQGKIISDANNIPSDANIFLFGIDKWGNTSKKSTS